MSTALKTAMGVFGLVVATQAAGQVTLYSQDGFRGESFTADRTISNMERSGFNDRAASAVVRGGNWQVCEDSRFEGRCAVLQPGEYASLEDMGLRHEISSIRVVEGRYGANDDRRYVTPGYDDRRAVAQAYDYRRRGGERLYEARVTSVRAVVGPAEQRCWVERRDYSGNANVPGAIAGAVIGGVLGHQIGGGRGQDAATIGGAVAGAAIGGNAGRGDYDGRDVQRCTDVSRSDQPDYWDVTYEFQGLEHRAQFSAPPGPTITVNESGEPRV